MTKNILIVAAHSDDEALGCGGTIARHASQGDTVRVLFMTDGVGARGSNNGARIRAASSHKAANILGVQSIQNFDFPDNKMDTVALIDVVQLIERCIDDFQPSIIYTHYGYDLNIDHRVTCQAVLTACRPQAHSPVQEIYSFEVPSSTEWASESIGPTFAPNMFIDISEHYETKEEALRAYDIEMRSPPHSRSYQSMRSLASWRGQSVGCAYAEAFKAVRILK